MTPLTQNNFTILPQPTKRLSFSDINFIMIQWYSLKSKTLLNMNEYGRI